MAKWWHRLADGRVQCDLCPRSCRLREGQRGFCHVRERVAGDMVLSAYGRNSGLALDPIEKKPLYHFYPGSAVLSFGTPGCNLGCRFCQNWSLTKATDAERLTERASPRQIAERARELGAKSVAFTYNDPVIFAEYAMDTADACHEVGVKTVAVTAGYVCAAPRQELFSLIDAANVDLKGFTEDFYFKMTGGHLEPVLETLRYLGKETGVWLEVTTLLIPGHNDSDQEVARLCEWILENLGAQVPLHFSAFHPDFRLRDVPRTPAVTLERARSVAQKVGLEFVYLGNVREREGGTTRCSKCREPLVSRDGYRVAFSRVTAGGTCPGCGALVAGRFGEQG